MPPLSSLLSAQLLECGKNLAFRPSDC